MKNEILLIPDKKDVERERLAKVWENAGGEVKRIGKFWIKPEIGNKRVSIYGYDSFCLVLAQILEIEMEMVKDEWIANLPFKYLKRQIEIKSINEIEAIEFPKFIKPSKSCLFIYRSTVRFDFLYSFMVCMQFSVFTATYTEF